MSNSTQFPVRPTQSRETSDSRPMNATRVAADLECITDEEAMAGVQAGSAAAFGVLHDRYRQRAYRIARSVCNDEGRAQEAVQEAFMSVWRTRMAYEHRRDVAPWLLTIVRNRAIDTARRNRTQAVHRADEEWLQDIPAPGSVDEQVVAEDLARHVTTVLATLPGAQREAITLAFYGQLTHKEIAARLRLPLGTVKGRIRLGMERLQDEIAMADGDERSPNLPAQPSRY